ncbi:hypothetical protein V1478_009128 [Vespula squamosa]|uniref:Uncharacterized protein n=1 Tax=Vespula squamosa TaxID=30214 RepID=A0ABD2AP28_VESSQ
MCRRLCPWMKEKMTEYLDVYTKEGKKEKEDMTQTLYANIYQLESTVRCRRNQGEWRKKDIERGKGQLVDIQKMITSQGRRCFRFSGHRQLWNIPLSNSEAHEGTQRESREEGRSRYGSILQVNVDHTIIRLSFVSFII